MSVFSPIFETRARKLARCGKCEGCTRVECGECGSCADKPRFGGPGVKKQACEARKCLRMSRQREEADPMPKKRAKVPNGLDWEKATLLQDMDILGEIDLSSDLDRASGSAEGGLPIDVAAAQSSPERAQGAKGTGEKGEKKVGPRLRRCGKCLPCNRGDCGSCHNCADKPKFGGSGVKKQACVARRCVSMLRRDTTPSPTLGRCEEIGASPSGVLDLWDPASWNQSLSADLTDPLGSAVVTGDDVNEEAEGLDVVEGLSYSDVLGDSSELLQSEMNGEGDKDEMSLQMGWSEDCIAAVELSIQTGTAIAPKVDDATEMKENVKEDENVSNSMEAADEDLLAALPFAKQASMGPNEEELKLSTPLDDSFTLSLASLTSLSSIDEPFLTERMPSKADMLAPDTPESALTEEDAAGNDEPLNLIALSPSDPEEDALDLVDPTGGVDGPLDDEDYCGWLAEDI